MKKENWIEIKRGAEASIWKINLFNKNCIAKVLEPKTWRAEQLDKKLRSDRIHNEARTNLKCIRLGIPTSPILFIDVESSTIIMEELTGPTMKKALFDMINDDDPIIIEALKEIGKIVSTLHNNEVVHADLTTSNFMFNNGILNIIDFGLSYATGMDEDFAVDLYVMERAFNSSHPGKSHLLEYIFDSYRKYANKSDQVFRRLKKVRSRGRKRSMIG